MNHDLSAGSGQSKALSPPARKRRGSLVPALIAGAMAAAVSGRLTYLSRHHAEAASFSPSFLYSPMAISLGLWLILSIYWELAARGASQVQSSESKGSRLLHLVAVNTALVLSFWPFPGWPRTSLSMFVFPRILPDTPYLPWIGVVLAAAGMMFSIWARHCLAGNWSGAVTVKVDHELVRTGPYRSIRHPIYTGLFMMYAGTTLISGRLQGPLAIALLAIAYARKIGMEERALRTTFRERYDQYSKESWALIPWVV